MGFHVYIKIFGDWAHAAVHALMRSAVAELRVVVIGDKIVNVRLPNSKEIRSFSVLLREPPPMLRMHKARSNDGRNFGLELRRSEGVLDLYPLPVLHANLASVIRIDFEKRIRIQVSQSRDLTLLGMEECIGAGTRGENERVFHGEIRPLDGAKRRLAVEGQGVLPIRAECG